MLVAICLGRKKDSMAAVDIVSPGGQGLNQENP
jgi:hypothetical protein